jgi:hypothetical protein
MVTVIKKDSSAEEVLKKMNKLFKKDKNKGIKNLCGVIKLDKDPVVLQKQWRDEWN